MMKIYTSILFLTISLLGFSQQTDIVKYESIYNTLDSKLHYVLYLTGTNEFFLYGGGRYQWDMLYPVKAFYGNYKENNDTLYFDFLPPDSLVLETDNGFYNKIAFYGDTIWVEHQKEYNPGFSSCVKRNNKIFFTASEKSILRNKVFVQTNTPLKYSFSIKGKLPVEFQHFASHPFFSFENTPVDIYMAQYPVSESSINVIQLDSAALDSFSIQLTNYAETSEVFIYCNKFFDVFTPIKVDLNSLSTDEVNEITLQYVNQHNFDWKYLNRYIPLHWPALQNIEEDCLTLNKYGRVVNFNLEKNKLKQKILNRHSESSYIEAYIMLIKSGYFKNMRTGIRIRDSLPVESTSIFKLLNTFTINDLGAIYNSYYTTSGSMLENKKIKKILSSDKPDLFISKAAFNAEKSICFLPVQQSNSNQKDDIILVFELRLNEYILTGKIEKGIYTDNLQGEECEYYTDFRNFRLFY